MSKPNNEADMKNRNKGTPGTNITLDKAEGNRGKLKNLNYSPPKVGKKK